MKKLIAVIITGILLASMLIGCGSVNKSEADNANENRVEVNDTPTEAVNEPDTAVAETKEETEKTLSDDDKKLAEASKEAYEKFLADSELLYFDNIYVLPDYSDEGMGKGIFYASEGLSLSKFRDEYSAGIVDEWSEEPYDVKDTLYSYIDCGDDGIPELALMFTGGMLYGSEYTDQLIIKLIDGKLELCYSQNAGYRSYCGMNKYGYTWYGGSNSALSHGCEYSVVDASGELHYVYYVEQTYSMSGVYSANEDYDKYMEAVDMGAEDDVEVDTYELLDRDEDYYKGDYDFAERQQKYLYTFYKVDENGNEINDPSIYDKDSPYMKLWESKNLPFYTKEEINEHLWERKASFGVTDKIENGEEIDDWTSITK